VSFQALAEPWSALSAVAADGYEIRYGVVSGSAPSVAEGVWVAGNVLATTVHGLFEDPAVVDALVGVRPIPVLDSTFDLLADAIDEHLDTELLGRVVGLA
jgi:adenosylcobyric acid synthase